MKVFLVLIAISFSFVSFGQTTEKEVVQLEEKATQAEKIVYVIHYKEKMLCGTVKSFMMKDLNPSHIEKINVLKDDKAVAYLEKNCAKVENLSGVIEIFLKDVSETELAESIVEQLNKM